MLVLIHVDLVAILAKLRFDGFYLVANVVTHDHLCDCVGHVLNISLPFQLSIEIYSRHTLLLNVLPAFIKL